MSSEAGDAASSTGRVPSTADALSMCKLLGLCPSFKPHPLTKTSGFSIAKQRAVASQSFASILFFRLTQKSRRVVDKLDIHFTCNPTIDLSSRAFAPVDDSPNEWLQAPDELAQLDRGEFVKSFGEITAGFISNAVASFALLLHPGEVVEWAFTAHCDPSSVELGVAQLCDVRAFHDEYTKCLKLTNDYASALELFQRNHIVECEDFLVKRYRALAEQKNMTLGQAEMNATQITTLKQEYDELQKNLELRLIEEESSQRSDIQQKRDTELQTLLAELRAEYAAKQTQACASLRQSLETEHAKAQSAEEAKASAAFEEALQRARTEFEERKAAVTKKISQTKTSIAAERQEIASLRSKHQADISAMDAKCSRTTQQEIAKAKEDIQKQAKAFYDRRIAEADLVKDQIRAVEKERALFETFHVIAREQLKQH